MPETRLDVVAFCLAAVASGACGSSLPAPTLAEHARETYVEVPYPPPAALAETVPPRPRVENVVWLDGDWRFRGKSYAWRRGGWVVPPSDARYAPSREVYLPDGRLIFAPGTWYDAQHRALPPPPMLVPATTPPNAVTPEFQTGR
jgi:hypothetical protein